MVSTLNMSHSNSVRDYDSNDVAEQIFNDSYLFMLAGGTDLLFIYLFISNRAYFNFPICDRDK